MSTNNGRRVPATEAIRAVRLDVFMANLEEYCAGNLARHEETLRSHRGDYRGLESWSKEDLEWRKCWGARIDALAGELGLSTERVQELRAEVVSRLEKEREQKEENHGDET